MDKFKDLPDSDGFFGDFNSGVYLWMEKRSSRMGVNFDSFSKKQKEIPEEFKDLGQLEEYSKVREEMKEILLQRITGRKNRVAASDEFVLKERDYTKENGIMIGVW